VAGDTRVVKSAVTDDHSCVVAEIHRLKCHLVKGAILDIGVSSTVGISHSQCIVTSPIRTYSIWVSSRILEGNCFLVLVVIVKGPVPYDAPIDHKADHVQEAAIGIKGTVVEKRRSANNNPDLIVPGRIRATKTDPTDRTGERGRVGNN
jgi:hypothetical protein